MSPDRNMSVGEAVDAKEREEQLRRRAAGLHDAERKKRSAAAIALVEELRRPLIDHHPLTNVEALLHVAPVPQRRRGGPGRPRKTREAQC